MACTLTSGFPLSNCNESIGGIKAIWFAAATDLYADANTTISGNEITASTSSITFYKMSVYTEMSSVSSNGTTSRENGTTFYEQQLEAQIRTLDPTILQVIHDINKARTLILVELNTGDYKVLGAENGCDSRDSTAESGQNFGDMPGIRFSATARETKGHFLCATAAVVDGSSWTLTEP